VILVDSPSTPSSSKAPASTLHAPPSSQSTTVKNSDPHIGYYPPNAWSTVSGTSSSSASLNVPSCSDSGELKESSTKGSNISYSFAGKLSCFTSMAVARLTLQVQALESPCIQSRLPWVERTPYRSMDLHHRHSTTITPAQQPILLRVAFHSRPRPSTQMVSIPSSFNLLGNRRTRPLLEPYLPVSSTLTRLCKSKLLLFNEIL
jgi:hypothetical protein